MITSHDEEELLKKFPDEFREMIHTNATAKLIFKMLLHGETPYHSIYRLLQINAKQYSVLEEVVNQSIIPGIIYDKESFEKLQSGK